jgi:hypothetical protein
MSARYPAPSTHEIEAADAAEERLSSPRVDLARRLGSLAALIDTGRDVTPYAGIVRQAARELLDPTRPVTSEGCAGCGKALPPPERTGSPRRWCGRGRCEGERKTLRKLKS